MENTRLREPPVRQSLHSHPGQMMLLAPMDQHAPPEPNRPVAKCEQAVRVSRYRVVVEVALYDRPEPLPGLRHRIMHALTELLLEIQQLGPHPLADRLALYRKVPVLVLPADVRESQKIKRLGLAFSSLVPVLFGKLPELNPARFVWVQLQPELLQTFLEICQEAVSFGPVLESKHIVIRVSDDNHLA
jgi:hypothetical protein